MANFAKAIQAVLNQNEVSFEELSPCVQSSIMNIINDFNRSANEVISIDGLTGFAAEGLVQVALLIATGNGDYIQSSTRHHQIHDDIDFFTKEGSVSVKSPMQSSPSSICGAKYVAFNIEMWAGDVYSNDNDINDNTDWYPSWGQTGKADMLFVVAYDRIVAYDYDKLKKLTSGMRLSRNAEFLEKRVYESGRNQYKTKTMVVPYATVTAAERKDMNIAMGMTNVRDALIAGGFNVQ